MQRLRRLRRALQQTHLFAKSKGAPLKVYWADSTDVITTPIIEELLASARTVLLESNIGLRHLALMTYGDNPQLMEEDLASRMEDIRTYLNTHFPIVVLNTVPDSYGETPDPTELPLHQPYHGPWLARSVESRRKLQLQFSLNIYICGLLKRSTDKRLMSFLLLVVIIHELAHVVMHIFATQPTPVRFYGTCGLENNPSDIDVNGAPVARGESGDSMENVMAGGDVSLALPLGCELHNVNSDDVRIVVRGPVGGSAVNRWKVLRPDMANLADIAAGDWSHIHNLPGEPYPDNLHPAKLKMSGMSMAAPNPPPSTLNEDYAVIHPSNPTKPRVKR